MHYKDPGDAELTQSKWVLVFYIREVEKWKSNTFDVSWMVIVLKVLSFH